MSSAYFRANVGICISRADGKVLAFRRVGSNDSWQFPQGGIHADESALPAALRELAEETGIRAVDVELIEEFPEWLTYEIPPEYRRTKSSRGQTQRWFHFRLRAEANILPDQQEFDAYNWLTPDELIEKTIAFRRPIYCRLFEAWFGPRNRS